MKGHPVEHLTLPQFQRTVGEWAIATFNEQPVDGIVAHLRREIHELEASFTDGAPDPMEAADCFILLVQLAHRMGWDLLALGETKHGINLTRRWGKPDAQGVIEHLDDVDCPECAGSGEETDPRIPTSVCPKCMGARKVPA